MALRPQSAPVGESTSLLQTSGSRARTRVKAPSIMSSIGTIIKNTVRRLSGGRERVGKIKGTYAAIPTEEDFQTTLMKSKTNNYGTYAILPPEESNLQNKTKLSTKPKPLNKIAKESDPVTQQWSAMKRAKEANERNI